MPSPSTSKSQGRLIRQWALLVVLSILALNLIYLWLVKTWSQPNATSWVLLATLTLVFQLWVLRNDLPLNFSTSKTHLLPSFGAGTWLSLVRLVSLSLLAGFLAAPKPMGNLVWLPFTFALVFNLNDLFDGYLARRTGTTTKLGAKLDLDLDGRGMLITTLLVVHYGQANPWFILAGLARYVYIFALWLQARLGGRLAPLQNNPLRRPFAGVEMGFATALLAPLFSPPVTTFTSTLTLFPFLGNFLYDWQQVTGRLQWNEQSRQDLANKAKQLTAWAALVLRGLAVVLLLQRFLVSRSFLDFDFMASLCLLVGFGGRPMVLLTLIVMAAVLNGQPLTITSAILVFALTALTYLGLGKFSLWEPEHSLIRRRLGEKQA